MSIRNRMWTQPLAERFSVAYYAEPNSGCWLWEGSMRNGYGVMKVSGRKHYAHRLSWEIYRGPVPVGVEVCHQCDNKCCVNPAHLFVGTHRDNMMDAWCKGIISKPPTLTGEQHHAARLTIADVAQIRNRRTMGETLLSIARDYGMTKENIGAIVRRQTWKETA